MAPSAAVCLVFLALARSFFVLIGLGMALWALAQGMWTLGPLARASRLLVAFQDILFVSCTAPLIAACVVRPDRPRPGALGLAADVGLVSVLALFVYTYFPVTRAALAPATPTRISPRCCSTRSG